jgi:anion-transporting  ArsA/GET3 family ATPase
VLPRIVFVLGKGGVGRSTVSAALGLALAERGERVLVFEWTVAEPIGPWFGAPAVESVMPSPIATNLSVANFRLDAVLKAYFVDHLRMRLFHRLVIDGPHVRRLVEAAPGIAELMFLGHVWWLTTLAEKEAGLVFDRIVVDAPATGHGASLLELPATVSALGATGLLEMEVGRVQAMMGDPARVGALVVALPDELSLEETVELVPRATRTLGRRPIAAFVNRCVPPRAVAPAPRELDLLGLSAPSRDALAVLDAELRARAGFEAELRAALAGTTDRGTCALAEQLALSPRAAPADVVRALAGPILSHLEAPR